MIRSYWNRETEELYCTGKCMRSLRRFPTELVRQAQRKLRMLDAAHDLVDLRVPPGNRLEALRGDREGQYSIRINARWRICFRWENEGPYDVEVVDYHR